MRKLLLKFLFCFFIVTGLAACGSGQSSSAPPANGPLTATLDTSSGGIADNATNVSKTPLIVIKFSQAMDPSTMNNETIKLSPDSAINIVSNLNNTIYTITVQSPLNDSTKYALNLSGVKSRSGQSLSQEFSFTTGDFTSPTVSIVSPGNGAIGVSRNPSIQIVFSEAVTGVTGTNVTLHEGSATGTAVPISSIVAGANNTYTFSPAVQLSETTHYYVVLGSGITDLSNNALSPTNFSFTTGDFTSPTVGIVSPSNGAAGVSRNPSIQLVFSEAVTGVTGTNVTLHEGSANGTAVSISNIIAGANNTYTFSPAVQLSETTHYYIVLGSGIKDLSNNALSPTEFSFSTGDFTSPTVSIVSPSNGATGVSRNPSIQIVFSEAVTGVNGTNVTLHENSATGTVVSISSIIAGANNTYTFSPAVQLGQSTQYYVVLSSGIKDISNNALSPTMFSFTTGYFAPPTVSIVSPSNGATGVSRSPSIQIMFSEAVTGVTESNVTLHEGSATGTVVSISSIVAGASNTYTFSPAVQLAETTQYYVVLSSGIKNALNTALSPTEFNFTTGDFTSPTASMVSPGNGTTGASRNPIIRIVFSEAVTGVNESNVAVLESSATGTPVSISSIDEVESNTYVVYLAALPLAESAQYYVVLGSGIQDLSNHALSPTEFSFTTYSSYFVAYYPPGCTISGGGTPCDCIQDPTTHDIWYALVNNSFIDWNSINSWAAGLNSGTCGFTSGWGLPSQTQLNTMATYASTEPDGGRPNWFNNNGFVNMSNFWYWGSDVGAPGGDAWATLVYNSTVTNRAKSETAGGLAVHPEP